MSDRTKGILCIIASAFGFALMALFVRLCDDYGGEISSFQKSFFRNAIALAIAAGVFMRGRRAGGEASRLPADAKSWGILLGRSAFGLVGIFANFYALSKIPIGEAMTLNKTAPFFTVFFSWLLMGEKASRRQIVYLLMAFAGIISNTRRFIYMVCGPRIITPWSYASLHSVASFNKARFSAPSMGIYMIANVSLL